MNRPSFIPNDLIRVVYTGQVGWVREVHQTDIGYVYTIQIKADPGKVVEVPEDELTLLKLAGPPLRIIKFRFFVEFSSGSSVHD